jgi:hypothetical protein
LFGPGTSLDPWLFFRREVVTLQRYAHYNSN